MVTQKPTHEKRSRAAGFFGKFKRFLSAQKEVFMARTSAPSMHGINLIQNNYTPSKLAEHPGYGSHEEIEPMK